jgi:hypothetical protein
MAETSREPKAAESAFWSWLGFWGLFVVLGLCVVLGAVAASRGEEPGNYTAGMVLILAALALAFLRLKQSFDEGFSSFGNFLFVDSRASLVIVIPLFVVIGLAGLFIASAWPSGSLHTGGIALFVASGAIVFLDIKQVFDRLDTR